MSKTAKTRTTTKNSSAPPANRGSDDGTFWFDEAAGEHPINFARKFVKHTDDHWAGKMFDPLPWQKDILRTFFGMKKADGRRKHRTLYLEIPRKNGKSTFAALMAVYVLFCCAKPRAQVIGAAMDLKQASIVFEAAKAMILASPALRKRCKILRNQIKVKKTGATYEVVSADSKRGQGLRPFCIIFDELHTQPNRKLYDALRMGQRNQLQPIEIYMTTAGDDVNSICYEVHEHAMNLLDGKYVDDSFLPVVYAADKEKDDWGSLEVWYKANPNLGITIPIEDMQKDYETAKRSPAFENEFKRYYLNIWTETKETWIPEFTWKKSRAIYDLKELRGQECYIALDLSKRIDMTAMALVFPNKDRTEFKTIIHFFIPEKGAKEREQRDRVPYTLWAQNKDLNLHLTPGAVIDYDYIEVLLLRFLKRYKVVEIAFDPWGSTQFANKLQKVEGVKVIEFGQGYRSMSPASKDYEAAVHARELLHLKNEILDWQIASTCIVMDDAGNIKPSKKRSNNRIDGVVAHIMAFDRAAQGKKNRSIYAERGAKAV